MSDDHSPSSEYGLITHTSGLFNRIFVFCISALHESQVKTNGLAAFPDRVPCVDVRGGTQK